MFILLLALIWVTINPVAAEPATHQAQHKLEKRQANSPESSKDKCKNPEHYNVQGQHYWILGESKFGDRSVLK